MIASTRPNVSRQPRAHRVSGLSNVTDYIVPVLAGGKKLEETICGTGRSVRGPRDQTKREKQASALECVLGLILYPVCSFCQ